jgi:hypothetical protein|tara:strand:- start:5 stop:424 length:420 start_codon:yes stop_codon:yes gene_type:complete
MRDKTYSIKCDVYEKEGSGGERVFEVMETFNLPEIKPGTIWRVKEDQNVIDWITHAIQGSENYPGNILNGRDIDVKLVHAYNTKRVKVVDGIALRNSDYGVLEVRHDHAGAFSNLYDISESINSVAHTIEENGKDSQHG